MDALKVTEAVFRQHLPIFCATCAHYRSGAEPMCVQRCGSPFARMDFPKYQGPILSHNYADWCFVCGESSDAAVQVHGSKRVFGMCREHLPWLDQIRPVGVPLNTGVDIITAKGRYTLEEIFPKRTTLGSVLAEIAEADNG